VKRWLILLSAAALTLALFACDEELQQGRIEGNVKDDGVNVSGAYVLLLEEGQALAGESPLGNGSITGGGGNYTILFVEPNTRYYIVAVSDTDGDVKYTPGVDPIGYFGRYSETTRQWYPSPIEIGSGEIRRGINIADMHIIPVVP
jgi:hypothetical protein